MSEDHKREYLQTSFLQKVLSQNRDTIDLEIVKCSLEVPSHFDGFMATIYWLVVAVKNRKTHEPSRLDLLVKVMKGDDESRRVSQSLTLFPNEINVYRNVLPTFKKLINVQQAAIDATTWSPRIFFAEQGLFPEYSDQFETILVMENVQSMGFTSGPRLDLDENHLNLMVRKIAQFHACSYALRLIDNQKLNQLVESIIPLNFVQDGKVMFESYDQVFRATQKRMFKYFESKKDQLNNNDIYGDIEMLKKKYGDNPSQLMQRCLRRDDVYSVILHGDYNRNNVLFKYEDGKAVDVLMIDFQENRFGSPALDLSFFMYMNMTEGVRNSHWDELLLNYHEELIRCITEITKIPSTDVRMNPYNFPNMMAHLSNYFIYGALIAAKFLPVMMGNPEDVAEISYYFHKDIYADGFRKALTRAGGEETDRRTASLLSHCSQRGYFKFLWT
ncbi:uncharacterized protein LOC134226856 [Armigeres subalbatus]|uniref:uncharacterized protein LOC134226856 n=1 Tax=Armigeres subalbatus TaxID=124917 RepID=UPI002ED328EF